jgi:hypothetical protein
MNGSFTNTNTDTCTLGAGYVSVHLFVHVNGFRD